MRTPPNEKPPAVAAAMGAEEGTTGRFADYSLQRSSGSPWATDNTAGFSKQGLTNLRQVQAKAYTEHGLDPCTLAQAAAHEAGHLVVAAALGDGIKGAKLFRSREAARQGAPSVWLGTTHRDRKTYTTPEPVFTASPARLVYEALNNLAGVVGEQMAGLDHPASSLDEVLAAQFACAELARRGLGEAEGLYRRVWGTCARIVDRNRQPFDVVRGHLEKRRRQTRAEAARMLAGVGHFPIEELVRRVLQ